MRLAVISDIHGNLDALLQVLKDLDRQGVETVVSLGDNIGYGAEPEGVLDMLRARKIPSTMGNHELAMGDPSCRPWFNPSSLLSLDITRRLLSQESLRFIGTFPSRLVLGDCLCVHGFPPDSILTYLFQVQDDAMIAAFETFEQSVCFLGHTHELELIHFDGPSLQREELSCGKVRLAPAGKYIVNVGSVGQPRDGDPRAKYVIWDDRSRVLEVRCVAYDIESAAGKILGQGFPRINAQRLRKG